MQTLYPNVPVELKTAAFKTLLQGPQAFSQFSSRFGVSPNDIRSWIDEATANLALADPEQNAKPRKDFSSLLTHEERRTLLEGKLPAKKEFQA